MDSLSQIVLGAAVGEVMLGKKIGNRAMLWGGIAGTIPDLDVLSSPFLTPLQGLVFHRGISHSLFFAVTFSFIISYFVKKYYDSNLYSRKDIRILASVLSTFFLLSFFLGIIYIFYFLDSTSWKTILFGTIFTALAATIITRMWKNYGLTDEVMNIKVSFSEWYWFFFWTIFTHPILDCFTVFGTQLWAPFSDQRVAWDNVAVADPFYTFPFGILLMAASFYNRSSIVRKYLSYAAILYSLFYMAWTFYNKSMVNEVLESTLKEENISYKRYMTNPYILNNFLWGATVETDSFYYNGSYSFFDKIKKFKLNKIEKNHEWLGERLNNDYTIDRLKWFSNNYFSIMKRKEGKLQFNDMRYGMYTHLNNIHDENSFIFKFVLEKNNDGSYFITDQGRPPRGNEKEMLSLLIQRIKGI